MAASFIARPRYVLAVKNLSISVAYYKEKLGMQTHWAFEGWHQLYRDNFIVMLGECFDDRSAFETRNHSYFAYIDVENIDALYEELTAKHAGIQSPLRNQPWGQREFSIQTVDGHRINFGQSIEELK